MTTLIEYLNYAFAGYSPSDGVMRYFYQQLFRDFNPDINGFTVALFVPPDLSGYRVNKFAGSSHYSQTTPSSYFGEVSQLMSFAAVDFTPPQSQVNTETISARTGAIPYATEVTESETCTVTYVETMDLDIYRFHHLWIEYIREVLEGVIKPAPEYLDPMSDRFGVIDYAGSLYILKYRPDMRTITFAAKCMGIFPQSLPTKELIGTRTSNELTTLPFTYFCAAYRETTSVEFDNWILAEIEYIASKFSLSWQGVLGLALNGFSRIIRTGVGMFGEVIRDITSLPGRAIETVMGEVAETISVAQGESIGGVADVTGQIMSFPKKLF